MKITIEQYSRTYQFETKADDLDLVTVLELVYGLLAMAGYNVDDLIKKLQEDDV
jgi:hypothetical protein